MTKNVLLFCQCINMYFCYNQSICIDINESHQKLNKQDGNGELAQNS